MSLLKIGTDYPSTYRLYSAVLASWSNYFFLVSTETLVIIPKNKMTPIITKFSQEMVCSKTGMYDARVLNKINATAGFKHY